MLPSVEIVNYEFRGLVVAFAAVLLLVTDLLL
jgi:hypothetical protein